MLAVVLSVFLIPLAGLASPERAPAAEAAPLPPAAAPAIWSQPLARDEMLTWDVRETPHYARYQADDGGYAPPGWRFELAGRPDTYGTSEVRFTATAKGAPPLEIDAPGPIGGIGVGEVDPRNPGPEALFTVFSMGAHCCTDVWVLELRAGRWRPIHLGHWDGVPLEDWPKDEDGDGVVDLLLYDDAFLYAFAPYSDSPAVQQVLNVVDGVARDVSAEPRYRPLFARDMESYRKGCGEGGWGDCAGFAANAARAGVFEEAWTFVLARYDRDNELDWALPEGCRLQASSEADCPPGQEIVFTSYPDALGWFLKAGGYITELP